MFSKIKRPLKRLAKEIQTIIRQCWHFLIGLRSRATSWAKATVLPRWQSLVSAANIARSIFHPLDRKPVIDETTSLLQEEDATEAESDDESVCSIPIRFGVPVKPLDIRVSPSFDLSKEATPKTFYYSVDPYCVICRKQLHMDQEDFIVPKNNEWGRSFLAICPAYTGQSVKYFAVALDVTQKEAKAIPPIGLKQNLPMLANIHIIKRMPAPEKKDKPISIPDANLRQDAHAVHRTCRSLAASMFKDQHVNTLISQFGQSTKFLARTYCCEGTWQGSVRSLTPHFAGLNQKDSLAGLLHRLSRCPTEIEDQIRDLIDASLLSTIINFFRTTVPLLRQMNQDQTKIQRLEFRHPFNYLEAHTTSIYESTFVNSLTLHSQTLPATPESRRISTKDVEGLQFTLGDYATGIRALKLLYRDGTTSEWIGSSPGMGIVTVIGTEISGLKLLRDNLKITGIELIAERKWNMRQRPFMLDLSSRMTVDAQKRCYMLPTYGLSSSLPFPGWRASDQNSLKKRNFNNWQVGKYISLQESFKIIGRTLPFVITESVCAITVYCLSHSVCGIVFYRGEDDKKRTVEIIGVRNPLACAIHMELNPFEIMVHMLAAVDTIKTEGYWGMHRCPPFIITTSRSRSLVCARIPISQHSSPSVRCTRIPNPDGDPINVLFTDGTTNPDGSICNIGVGYLDRPPSTSPPTPSEGAEMTQEQVLHIPSSSQPSDLPETWKTAFISVASFAHVTNISAHRRGDRLLGLRIRIRLTLRETEVLGQYDPLFPSEIKTLFDSEINGELLGITFTYTSKEKIGWGYAAREYISNVDVQFEKGNSNSQEGSSDEDPTSPKSRKKTFTVSQEELKTRKIAWIFTPTDDRIQYWNDEDVQKVEVEEDGPRRNLLLNPGLELPERDYDEDFVLWDEHEFEGSDGDGDDD